MQVASKVADVVATAVKMDIKVEWIDKVFGEVAAKWITLLCFKNLEVGKQIEELEWEGRN